MSEPNTRIAETGTLQPLVEAEWLEEHLDDPNLRVVDATVQVKLWPFPHIKTRAVGVGLSETTYQARHLPIC